MIRFLLNDTEQTIHHCAPDTTVLNYLRQQRLTGTKEGCASGDCGACTAVLAEVSENSLTYRSINTCLTFLPALHGKQLITIEGLKNGDTLHPAQQAMVDCHGSQCGFCTPGIVMSLFAMQKHTPSVTTPEEIMTQMAGNLCRCTGYQPIINAAKQLSSPCSDKFSQHAATTLTRLQQLQCSEMPSLSLNGLTALLPRTLEELDDCIQQHPDARLLAGGTDLALEVTQLHKSLNTLIYLGHISELQSVTQQGDRMSIGAARPLTDCIKVLTQQLPQLDELLHRFASMQIRNQATLGGNLANASPIGDMAPVLLAADAEIVLRKAGQSRTVPLAQFFLDYKKTLLTQGEYISHILLPAAPQPALQAYKVSKRLDDDISAVCGVFNIEITHNTVTSARIGFGGMAATPKRATACEQALLNQPWDQQTLERAMQALAHDFSPLSDLRASADYRQQVAANLLKRYWLETQHPNTAMRVTRYA